MATWERSTFGLVNGENRSSKDLAPRAQETVGVYRKGKSSVNGNDSVQFPVQSMPGCRKVAVNRSLEVMSCFLTAGCSGFVHAGPVSDLPKSTNLLS